MPADKKAVTPMMKQYFEVKNKYEDCILMYRLGDFYEMFYDDALVASKILDITLTGRNCGQEERAPMCGVPFHSVESYIVKLVNAGLNVAICEQTEDPAKAKGIVGREVVRVVTPGTVMSSVGLDDKKNNYLCSVAVGYYGAGIAFVDITTGECYADEFTLPYKESGDRGENTAPDKVRSKQYAKNRAEINRFILNRMSLYAPTEVIMNSMAYEDSGLVDDVKHKYNSYVRNFYEWAFSAEEASKNTEEQFGSLEKLGIISKRFCLSAVGAALEYLKQTQKMELSNLTTLRINSENDTLEIDMYSMRNLELMETLRDRSEKGSLFNILNKTKTSMGARTLRRMIAEPLKNCAMIQNRHLAVDEMVKKPILREEIREALKGVGDIERVISKIAFKSANCQDLLSLKNSFERLPEIGEALGQCGAKLLQERYSEFDELKDMYELISTYISDEAPVSLRMGNMIKKGASEELDRLKSISVDGKQWLNALVEQEKEKTGIKNMKLGYNKVFGYYIEVRNLSTDKVPDYFIRKQTLVNAERYITPEIKKLEEEILNAETSIADMEYNMFCEIRDKVASNYARVKKTAEIVAFVDVICSFAYTAEQNSYVMPNVNMGDKIIIKDGRHPVVEKLNKETLFIPNDVTLNNKSDQIAIITGPNMAGKSTYMRACAVIVIMAQMGSFVPASYAEIGIVDKIFTRVGASDDLASGDSTFMVEMKEVAYILDNATRNSLIILDEIGRGTSTYDGISIAWAVVEHIADVKKCGAKTMFATHYHELTILEDKISNVKNYCIAVKKNGDKITFLRKIVRGGADESYGVEVAALAGVKKSVIRRAKEIAAELESRGQKTVDVKDINVGSSDRNGGKDQLNFLSMESENSIISEIKSLDLNTMSPVEALTKLFDLQAKANNG